MKNFSKAGLLIITLVIPALIFTFLKFFARNHYDLPYFNPEMDANGKVVIENGDTTFRKIDLVCPGIRNADIKGNLTLISSLSGKCDTDCRTFIGQLQRINNLTDEISELRILTLADTANKAAVLPEAIQGNKWSFVPVSENVINNCLQINPASVKTANDFDKRWRLMLIDKEGYVRGYYNGKDVSETDRLMAEIKILDYEGETSAK